MESYLALDVLKTHCFVYFLLGKRNILCFIYKVGFFFFFLVNSLVILIINHNNFFLFFEKKKIETSEGKQLEPLFTLNPKENVLMTSQIINSCVNLRTLKLSQFFIQPESRIREIFPWDSLQGKLQLYSILSLHFRANCDIDVADKFLKYKIFFFFFFLFFFQQKK